MTKTLVIVESPAKAKTIKKYLGTGYEVYASKGHVKDLPKKQDAVDVSNDFTERYEVIEGKEKVLEELKSAAKKADEVLLATDPDREGEAIAFHIQEEIKSPRLKVQRVEFHEITKKGIEQGVQHPRALDVNLYDAQRARRVLDRIVGYDVSALVWSKLAFGLSAGRVQSVALRLIVDREREIGIFVPEEYWNIGVGLSPNRPAGEKSERLVAKVVSADGRKLEVTNGETAAKVRTDLESASYKVARITRREQRRNPPAPYTTSKLQQDATSYLHFGTKRTMQIAQALYEGIDLKRDGGPVGLITYMRTDSTRVSDDAIAEVRQYVGTQYGKDFVPERPNVYKSKKNAQDAHEAIRPTSVELHPDAIRKHLKDEQYKLYKLIWNRFVASQMMPAVYDRTTAEIEVTPAAPPAAFRTYLARASGRILKFPGWLQVTEGQQEFAGEDEANAAAAGGDGAAAAPAAGAPAAEEKSTEASAAAEEDTEALLPDMTEGELLRIFAPPGVLTEQKFTQPPPRYNEGSLVRELEKRGIGRPSTYAEIISKVQQRAYVEKLPGGAFQPTELGRFVVDGLVRSNLDFMDPNFTAQMEEELDEVGAGKVMRVQLLKRFYKRFREQLDSSKKLAPWKPESERTDIVCEECGATMLKKWGKNGWFLSCERYPKCKSTRNLDEKGAAAATTKPTDIICDKCSKPMVIRTGRFGEFLSCTGYPACKNARPIPLGVSCPKCGGEIIEIRPRKKGGRTFYGCSNWNAEQKCDFKLWQKPVPVPCPNCDAKFLTRSVGKQPMLICADKECGYKRETNEEELEELSAYKPGMGGPRVVAGGDLGEEAEAEAFGSLPDDEENGGGSAGARGAKKSAAGAKKAPATKVATKATKATKASARAGRTSTS
ncbi:type I DNA topoisomerase [Chondromyces crocatus]|uniref:DNA topoisomerase 1 n=1 Tax=Chondromyces crocatus TaxID=52 RepID=A0A0K1EDK4_CHOCO|nr:type I DNA topoisomerase [Chondromyces crocatus]AKT38956.1 DNA topoisomerase I [Chondromyces crocatus]